MGPRNAGVEHRRLTRRARRWLLALVLGASACKTTSDAKLTPREHALRELQQGRAAAAIPLLEAQAALAPQDLELARALTEAYVKAGQAQQLIDKLTARVSAASPPLRPEERHVVHYMLGLAHFARSADADGPAASHFEQAIQLRPELAELHYRLGVALLESERHEASLPRLEKAVTLEPARTALYLPLAKAYARAGDRPRAVAALGKSLDGDLTAADVATARALMSRISDPFAGVPGAVRPKLDEGLLWLHDRDVPQRAMVALEEVLRDYPDLAVVHALLGLAYQRLDDAGRAVEEFKRAIELAPDQGQNHLYLGELYLGRQRPAQAQEHLEKAIALHPLLDDARLRLADLAIDRGDYPAARRQLLVLVRLSPDSVPARGKLAAVYQLEGDYPAAERELRVALERVPNDPEFLLRLGLLHTERYTRAKNPTDRAAAAAEASRWLTQVLELQPDNALASKALERVRGR
jgi:tetratricopeptide (TPR) repeat protein